MNVLFKIAYDTQMKTECLPRNTNKAMKQKKHTLTQYPNQRECKKMIWKKNIYSVYWWIIKIFLLLSSYSFCFACCLVYASFEDFICWCFWWAEKRWKKVKERKEMQKPNECEAKVHTQRDLFFQQIASPFFHV